METELNNCKYKPKDKVEIINFALSGTGQARQFEMQQGFAKKYETDIILAVAHSNDPKTMLYIRARCFLSLLDS